MKMKTGQQAFAFQSGGVADPRQGAWVATNDLGASKGKKYEAHTAPTKYGMGDHYGTALKAKLGKMRSDSVGMRPVSRKQLGKPPKNLA